MKINKKLCECGCRTEIGETDKYFRKHRFVSGHNGRKYDDPRQYIKEWNHRNRSSRYKLKLERGHNLKKKIILIMGSKCMHCNVKYDGKNACIFQLHHKKPKNKLFAVNTRTLINYSWVRILKEIKKCELLCGNCHAIYHNMEY